MSQTESRAESPTKPVQGQDYTVFTLNSKVESDSPQKQLTGAETVISKDRFVSEDPEMLKISSQPDENEFECFKDSSFSMNFQMPIRQLCPCACHPYPGKPDYLVITEIIKSTKLPGDLCEHFLENSQRKQLNFQLSIYLLKKDEKLPDWQTDELKHRFVYNSFDPEEEVDYKKVCLTFCDSRDLDLFNIFINQNKTLTIALSNLKEMKFPPGAKYEHFISKEIAMYQDTQGKMQIHNPSENEHIGSFDVKALIAMCDTTLLLTFSPYQGKILFTKKWKDNKIFQISYEDFVAGNFENYQLIEELKFPEAIEADDSGAFSIFAFEDRLILRNWQVSTSLTRFFDTKGRTVSLHTPENAFKKFVNWLTAIQQSPEDTANKKGGNRVFNGHLDYITAFDMSTGRTYYQNSLANASQIGNVVSAKVFDPRTKRMVEVGYNNDLPIEEVVRENGVNSYIRYNLHQGRKMYFDRGMVYLSVFHDQIHQLDCQTKNLKIYPLEPSQRVLSAVKFAQFQFAYQMTENSHGLMLYDLEKQQVQLYVNSANSKDLKKEFEFDIELSEGIPRDSYQLVFIKFKAVKYLIFQRKEEITNLEFKNGKINKKHKEALPIDMHFDKSFLFTVRKPNKGLYEIVRTDYLFKDYREIVIGTDPSEIVATACISLEQSTRIVSLNIDREIKIYEVEKKTSKFYANIALDSFLFTIPLEFPQFFFNEKDLSVVFNGRDYCAYTNREELDLRKPLEEELFTQFIVDKKDFKSQVLTESPCFNTYMQSKLRLTGNVDEIVKKIVEKRNINTYVSNNEAQKITDENKVQNFNYEAVPVLFYGINRTESFSVKRGLRQQTLSVQLNKEVTDIKFDPNSQCFLVLSGNELQIFDKIFKYLRTFQLEEFIVDKEHYIEIEKSKFDQDNGCRIVLSNNKEGIEEERLLVLDLTDLQKVKVAQFEKFKKESEYQSKLVELKALIISDEDEVISYHQLCENKFVVQTKSVETGTFSISLQEKIKKDKIIERKRLDLEEKADHFQDFQELGLLIHTKSKVIEFFSELEVFSIADFADQVKRKSSNSDRTVMVAQEKMQSRTLHVFFSNTKEFKRYSDGLKKPELTPQVVKGLKREHLTQVNPDSLKNLFLTLGLRKVDHLQLLNETLTTFKDAGDEKAYKDAVKMIFYPLVGKEREQMDAWDTFSLAILKDFKGAGDLLLQNIAYLLASGDEINSLVIKDLNFFQRLLNYNNFPEVLDSIQGNQQVIEVFNSKIPEEGLSFLAKKAHLSHELIEKKIGEIKGSGLKETLFMRKVQMDFLKKENVLGDFCALLDRVKDDKILGNETLEVVIEEIWRKTQPKILKYIFLPYMIYFSLFITYISFLFNPYEGLGLLDYFFIVPCLLYSFVLLIMETQQMIREGKDYFVSVGVIWNIIDITSSLFVSFFIVANILDKVQNPYSFIIGGLGVFFLWLKLFYFMRMFQDTAAFVRMIIEMFIDIRIFMFIFFVGILAFSNCFYVLDMYTRLDAADQIGGTAFDSIAGNSYMDSFKYVYLQSLGELGFDGYDSSYAPTIYWAFFFASSLFLQITLLNLLIAIMGDTFDRIQEVQREAKTKERCSILSEYAYLIPQEKIVNNSCIYVASYENRDDFDNQGGWEGKLTAMKHFFSGQIEKMGKMLEKSTERLDNRNNQNRKAVQSQIEQIQTDIITMKNKMELKEEKDEKTIHLLEETEKKLNQLQKENLQNMGNGGEYKKGNEEQLIQLLESNKASMEQAEKERQELKAENAAQKEILLRLTALLEKQVEKQVEEKEG